MAYLEKSRFFHNYSAKMQNKVRSKIRFVRPFSRTEIELSAKKKDQMIPWLNFPEEKKNCEQKDSKC